MQRYILKRMLQAAVTIILVSMVIFVLARLSGNPLDLLLPPEATLADRQAMSEALGLNKPILTQYGIFAKNAVRGDFGESIKWDEPAWNLVWSRFPNTLQLAVLAMSLNVMVGLTLGMYSALRPGGMLDSFGKVFALLGQSVPTFWTGIMLILILSVQLHLLPTSGKGPGLGELQGWKHLIMPAFTLGWFGMASTVRLSRSAMLDVLDSEFIKMVRIKGLPERTVIWKHALKNASIPILTLAALQFAGLLNGSVIVEVIFAWPGMGRLAYDAVLARDFPVVQTAVFVGSSIFISANLLVDIAYAYLDPRIRYQ